MSNNKRAFGETEGGCFFLILSGVALCILSYAVLVYVVQHA